jgi:hypothetical protein
MGRSIRTAPPPDSCQEPSSPPFELLTDLLSVSDPDHGRDVLRLPHIATSATFSWRDCFTRCRMAQSRSSGMKEHITHALIGIFSRTLFAQSAGIREAANLHCTSRSDTTQTGMAHDAWIVSPIEQVRTYIRVRYFQGCSSSNSSSSSSYFVPNRILAAIRYILGLGPSLTSDCTTNKKSIEV